MRLRDVAFDASPVALVVIDANGFLALANESARSLLGLATKDLGRPVQDLELSYRPVELRSLIEQAYAERRSNRVPNVEKHHPDGNVQYLDVQVTPLSEDAISVLGVSISYDDVTYRHKLLADLQRSTQELENAYEELQSAHEELETSNEELQSTNEELETTNEELQSGNEELETMNEELQSTNEELETSNTELRTRTAELSRALGFLNSILSGVRVAVIVLDRELKVLVWNAQAEEMWGVRADEAQGRLPLGLGYWAAPR